MPASTPHDKAVLAGEVTNTPIPQRDAEYTFRSREEGLLGLSEGEIGYVCRYKSIQ